MSELHLFVVCNERNLLRSISMHVCVLIFLLMSLRNWSNCESVALIQKSNQLPTTRVRGYKKYDNDLTIWHRNLTCIYLKISTTNIHIFYRILIYKRQIHIMDYCIKCNSLQNWLWCFLKTIFHIIFTRIVGDCVIICNLHHQSLNIHSLLQRLTLNPYFVTIKSSQLFTSK